MYDIGHMSAEAKGLQDAIYSILARPWESFDIDQSAMRFTFDEAVPTLLIMKLSAAIEDTLDVLWTRRFPEVDTRRLRHEDKLSVMEKLHNTDLDAVRDLWKLRNQCAHSVKIMATTEQFEKHFDSVYKFVALFQKEEKPRSANRRRGGRS